MLVSLRDSSGACWRLQDAFDFEFFEVGLFEFELFEFELKERLSQASFKVVHAVESDGLSAHGNDNPVVIRLTAERVVGFEYLVSTPYALEPDNLTFTS